MLCYPVWDKANADKHTHMLLRVRAQALVHTLTHTHMFMQMHTLLFIRTINVHDTLRCTCTPTIHGCV